MLLALLRMLGHFSLIFPCRFKGMPVKEADGKLKRSNDMKVKSSIRSLARKDGSHVVRRRGHLYVINKKNPHWKARQG